MISNMLIGELADFILFNVAQVALCFFCKAKLITIQLQLNT